MVRIPALQSALMGLIGLQPHYNATLPQYAPDLLECRSGLYLNFTHPLIAPENLIAALPKVRPAQFPQYAGGKLTRGMIRRNSGTDLFIALKDGEDAPLNDAEFWATTDYISAKLRHLIDTAAAQVVNQVIQRKKIAQTAKAVIEETQLYHGAGNINNRIVKTGRFCGFEISVKHNRDIVVRISKIGLQMDTANPGLNLYLYHSTQAAPIKVIPANFQGTGMFSWANVPDIYLALNDEAYGPGGHFFFGYYEDDLAGQIIDREYDWTNAIFANCGSCNPDTAADFQIWSDQLEFHPFSIEAADLDAGRALWNHQRVQYAYTSNFGINLTVALECDITQFLARNETMLADAVSKQAAINVLNLFVNTTENDALAEKCKQAALYHLDRREFGQMGLTDQLSKALDALMFDVVDDNSPCLPKAPQGYRITDALA